MAKQHGLGRGLSSLIPPKQENTEGSTNSSRESLSHHKTEKTAPRDIYTKDRGDIDLQKEQSHGKEESPAQKKELTVIGVAIDRVFPNSQQPRMYFDEKGLQELAQSIEKHGILQPLVVIANGDDYELIAGERRLRAAKLAGLTKVPVILRGDMTEQKKLELAIIENVQRHDLNIIEEAKSYKKLADEFNLLQEDIAERTGKSRSTVANRMRLMQLPVEVQPALIDNVITEGHAKIILSLDNAEKQRALYDMIVAENLSVRDTERALRKTAHVVGKKDGDKHDDKAPQERVLEEQLAAYFGTKVKVKSRANGGGDILVTYFSQDELRTILTKLKF